MKESPMVQSQCQNHIYFPTVHKDDLSQLCSNYKSIAIQSEMTG